MSDVSIVKYLFEGVSPLRLILRRPELSLVLWVESRVACMLHVSIAVGLVASILAGLTAK